MIWLLVFVEQRSYSQSDSDSRASLRAIGVVGETGDRAAPAVLILAMFNDSFPRRFVQSS